MGWKNLSWLLVKKIDMKYLKNYKLFENFFTESQNKNNIMISNNEISKVYFGNEDWEKKNLEREYRDRIGEDVIKWSKRVGAVAVINLPGLLNAITIP